MSFFSENSDIQTYGHNLRVESEILRNTGGFCIKYTYHGVFYVCLVCRTARSDQTAVVRSLVFAVLSEAYVPAVYDSLSQFGICA